MASISTAGKVSGAALTSLASIPSGAGVIPSANLPAAGPGGTLGSYKNLKLVYASVSTVTLTIDEITLENSSNVKLIVRALSGTISSASNGAVNKLDTGTVAANTIYYVWAISDTITPGGILSLSSTAPTLPSGYTYKALVGATGTNNSSNFIPFTMNGRDTFFTTWATMASGAAGLSPWVAVDLTPANMTTNAGFVPTAISTFAMFSLAATTSTTSGMTNNNSVADSRTIANNKFINIATSTGASIADCDLEVLTTDTVYWLSDDAANKLYLRGFRNNLL